MIKEHLEVFGRIKPWEKNCNLIESYHITDSSIEMQVARSKLSNAKDAHQFQFNRIFTEKSEQEDVFQKVAQPVIDNCLDGYNGTIFAYGQTGSGKTYTMSGGDKWEQRGVIPRVLCYVFQEFHRRVKEYKYHLHVSFIQIYNESAYDLLDPKHEESNFEEWSKIIFLEDEESNLQMKNVEWHEITSQQEGLDLLMMGSYIRKVNATSLNQTSSRSHCIFTLNITGVNLATLVEVYSKLHLVDLAGSQRVSKSMAEGVVLTEAKSINLSLTYLEQVIVSLNQKSRSRNKQHIPYRNSLLTTLLKDSLGGNCKTVMIATFSLQKTNIEETLSTLRFAQRVRLIQNQLVKNEKNLYSNRIETLERENQQLKRKLEGYEKEKPSGQGESEEEIAMKVKNFMAQGCQQIQLHSIEQAQRYLQRIREVYNNRLRQYVIELNFISEKMLKYDEMLSLKENRRKINESQQKQK